MRRIRRDVCVASVITALVALSTAGEARLLVSLADAAWATAPAQEAAGRAECPPCADAAPCPPAEAGFEAAATQRQCDEPLNRR